MLNSYTTAMRNYATFSGRMSRAAYWQFTLVYAAIGIVAFIFDNIIGTANEHGGLLVGLVVVAHLAPSLASLARRLHDSDSTALWLLALLTGFGGLILMVFACWSGTPGPNRFGDQPTKDYAAQPLPSTRPSPAANEAQFHQEAKVDIVGELERLSTLRSNGSLSDSEYEVMKSRLFAKGV
jgi:uncharacterized membrane protein YhaH (DUF805 family)